MTTKTEPGSAATDSDTAPALRGGAPAGEPPPEDDDRARVGGLPSIIVDPAAYAMPAPPKRDDEQSSNDLRNDSSDDEAQSETQIAGSPATHANGASAELDAPAPAESSDTAPALRGGASTTMSETAQNDFELPPEDRLTVEDAERFAESFRPSWHSLPAVTPSPMPSAAAPVPSAEASDGAIDSVFPRSQRRRSLALVAGAVLVFAGLIAMAMSSAHGPEPSAKVKSSAAAKAPPPAEPVTAEPAAPTAPAPAALGQPALAAPAPGEPTPAPATGETTPTEATAAPAVQPELAQATGTAVPAAPLEPTAAPPAASPTAAPVPAAAPPEPAAAAAAPVEPTTVRIQLQTTPESATLLIDGATVGNPYDQTLPKSGKHRVRVEAPGYRESEITLNFDRDRDLSVRLQKLRGRAGRRSAPAPSIAAPRPVAPAAPAPPVLSIKPAAPEKRAPVKAAPAKTPPKGAGFVSESPY